MLKFIVFAWIATGLGTYLFAFVDAVEDGADAQRVISRFGWRYVIGVALLFAAVGPVSLVWWLKK